MKSVLSVVFSLFSLVSCGSAAEIAAALKATPVPDTEPRVVWTATPLPARPSESNESLQTKLLGQWDLFSRNCEGEQFSFDFSNDGTCYILQKYGQRYKCTWSWIAQAQIKFCVGANCRTDMLVSFSGDMLTVLTDKCETEYKRPEVLK